jgi:predicted ATPase
MGIQRRGHVLHILETHSEYLLLRCLKRLRQTAQGLHPENSPQRLTPEQLSVLYFDPRPDGTTHVRRIRVTEDGEFIDRWPRGFFEERGQELFDDK